MVADTEPEVSVVIPCYNEAATIAGTAASVLDYMAAHQPGRAFELVLVNDGSTDQTLEVLETLRAAHPVIRIASYPMNRGRGAAIKTGLAATAGDVVILLDADLSYDVEHIGQILAQFDADPRLDVVVVSPYMRRGVVRGVPMSRLLLSRAANSILGGFFSDGLSTVTCVVRGYRGRLIRALPLLENGKELHLEILRKMALVGAKIIEIPGRLVWRHAKERAKRGVGLHVIGAAKKHILYGMLIKPTRVMKYITAVLFAVGFYELGTLAVTVFASYDTSAPMARALWSGLSAAFAQSPHTVVIASLALVLGTQCLSYLALLQVLKLQQEEVLHHLLTALSPALRAPEDTN